MKLQEVDGNTSLVELGTMKSTTHFQVKSQVNFLCPHVLSAARIDYLFYRPTSLPILTSDRSDQNITIPLRGL